MRQAVVVGGQGAKTDLPLRCAAAATLLLVTPVVVSMPER